MSARFRRLVLFLIPPCGLLALVSFLVVGTLLRGTWADTQARNPATVADGPICQLLALPDGSREARCAICLPHPLEEVWQAITDYEHYGDICSHVKAEKIDYDPSGPTRIEATTTSGLGAGLSRCITFTVQMRFEQNLHEYVAAWDQPGGDVLVNRGRWVLKPSGPQETILTLSMEVQVKNVPACIMHNISLHRVEDVVRCTQRRLRNGPSGKGW